jgi:rhamnosyltransferase subunit B
VQASPYSHDQPDNARRMERLGVARVLLRERYTGAFAATRLRTLLSDESYTREAIAAQASMALEDGLHTACDALEAAATRGAQR